MLLVSNFSTIAGLMLMKLKDVIFTISISLFFPVSWPTWLGQSCAPVLLHTVWKWFTLPHTLCAFSYAQCCLGGCVEFQYSHFVFVCGGEFRCTFLAEWYNIFIVMGYFVFVLGAVVLFGFVFCVFQTF